MVNFINWEEKFLRKNIKLNKPEYDTRLGISFPTFRRLLERWRKLNLIEEWITVIDIETTHINPNLGMIIEIGFCFLELNKGEIIPGWNIICQEYGYKIDENAWIFYNSDLSPDDIRNAPYLNEFKKELQLILDMYPVTCFNHNFDLVWLRARGFKIKKTFFDPMIKLTPIMRIPHDYYIYKYPSVEEAWRYLFPDIEYKEKHRALDDAMHEARIIYETNKILNEKVD